MQAAPFGDRRVWFVSEIPAADDSRALPPVIGRLGRSAEQLGRVRAVANRLPRDRRRIDVEHAAQVTPYSISPITWATER